MATTDEKPRDSIAHRRARSLQQRQMEHRRDGLLDKTGFAVVAEIGRVEFTDDGDDMTATAAAFQLIGEADVEKSGMKYSFPNRWGGITTVTVDHDNPVDEEPDHSQAV